MMQILGNLGVFGDVDARYSSLGCESGSCARHV
jgi:hypothetical protein